MYYTILYIGFQITKIILTVLLAVCLISIFIIGKKTKGVYDEYISALDEKMFKLKKYLYLGLYLSSVINISSFVPNFFKINYYRYISRVKSNISELYGIRFSDYYYEIHTASKWTVSVFIFTGMVFLAVISGFQGNGDNTKIFGIGAFIVAGFTPFFLDYRLNEKINEKRLAISMEFPEFINKLLLLVNAGMTISKAWEKIVLENKKQSPLYMELDITMAEINGGKPEATAYEEFARRCKIKEVIKCVSIIVLNLKKGGAQVVPALREQSDDCWELRKAAARQQGEKASSKLMLPMAIMLIGIIMIVVMPAVMALQGV